MSITKCPHCGEPISVQKVTGPAGSFDRDQALGLLKFGATPSEVAKAFGVSRQRIYNLRAGRT